LIICFKILYMSVKQGVKSENFDIFQDHDKPKLHIFSIKINQTDEYFLNFFSICQFELLFFNFQSSIFAGAKSQKVSINLKLNKKW